MNLTRIATRLASVHRYPRYLSDLALALVLRPLLRVRAIRVARGVSWLGWPIITKHAGSSISIGYGCVFCSRSAQTALGVNHPVVIRTLRSGAAIDIGEGSRMSGTTICAASRVVIGRRCVIGANVTIADTDFHSLDPAVRSSPQDAASAKAAPVEIGDDVFIGGGSFILKGVRIGHRAVIGAGSVVTRSVLEDSIVAGNPAVVVRGPRHPSEAVAR